MSDESNTVFRQFLSEDMLDVLVRVGLIAAMVVVCFRIFAPFMNLVPRQLAAATLRRP